MNIDTGSYRGWKISFNKSMVIFRAYVNLPEGYLKMCIYIYKYIHLLMWLTIKLRFVSS